MGPRWKGVTPPGFSVASADPVETPRQRPAAVASPRRNAAGHSFRRHRGDRRAGRPRPQRQRPARGLPPGQRRDAYGRDPRRGGAAHDPDGAPRPHARRRHRPAVGQAVGRTGARIATPDGQPSCVRRVEHERRFRVLHARLDARAVHLLQPHDPGRDSSHRASSPRQDQDGRAEGRLPACEGVPAGARAAGVSALHVPLDLRHSFPRRRGDQEHGGPPRLSPADGRDERQRA